MNSIFINYFKKSIYLIVLIGFNVSFAGSYEDFFIAIKRDDPQTIQQLLARGFDANTLDPNSQHGLYLALQEPSLKAAQALIDWPKTDLNHLNAQGESALMIAALSNQLEVARQLLKRGADVNKTGWSPLHYAATHGHLAMISLLLENHAYIDAESPNGSTPLMMAALYGSAESVRLLLEEGADPLLKNQLGLTAIDFAHRASRIESAEVIARFVRRARPAGQW
ncbi:ankyrin repeat domain-containing protein [Polaromonas sp.]|uniref:ankyrin repeat domain-containing protein n=1 Tax=Polaromonas sp. TaxID=1869339 RepID=UPI002FCC239D